MIARWNKRWRAVRRLFSRSEWAVRWLGLPRSASPRNEDGLILVQIDGLSRRELEDAISSGKMPFLKSLVERERYQTHSFYSGMPSSTPAVQGELFYGVKCAVPAFGFVDHETGQPARMFSPSAAAKVQEKICRENEGLLAGGSSYCNIYDGGAEESHFCAASIGWDQVMLAANPWKLILLALGYGWSLVRAVGLTLIELGLATFDFLMRVTSGRELTQEFIMIASRVVVAIGLRELTIIGASIDATRGLPIIHLNLLGYDEHAHRRGPSSSFARWTLKGIDRSIKRLAAAADLSEHRDYDLWIYSDHGQATTVAYPYLGGKSIQEACNEVIASASQSNDRCETDLRASSETRAQWLSAGRMIGRLFGETESNLPANGTAVQVIACGPLGFVYADQLDSVKKRLAVADLLVTSQKVPMVVVSDDDGATAVTCDGRYRLPEQSRELFGTKHPFASETACDLVDLSHHPDAGQLVLSGWRRDEPQISFAVQAGAHAGPGPIETHGFALLPCDAPLPRHSEYLRPDDLRHAALAFQHRETEGLSWFNGNWNSLTGE